MLDANAQKSVLREIIQKLRGMAGPDDEDEMAKAMAKAGVNEPATSVSEGQLPDSVLEDSEGELDELKKMNGPANPMTTDEITEEDPLRKKKGMRMSSVSIEVPKKKMRM